MPVTITLSDDLAARLQMEAQAQHLSLEQWALTILGHVAEQELDRAGTIASIQRGLEAMEDGRTRPVKEFLAELQEESGFPESRSNKK